MYGNANDGGGTDRTARQKVTAPAMRARKGGRPITMVTAYDYTMARLLDSVVVQGVVVQGVVVQGVVAQGVVAQGPVVEAGTEALGIDALLVGDSLGMVVQGQQTTIPVTLDEICYHTRAVARAASSAHVVGDMPFMSFQVSPTQAVESAGKLMKEGMAESVKLEGGAEVAEHVVRITRAGIPVMGHVGLTPQSVHALGGFKVQGKGQSAAERIIADAVALEEAGVYAIVLEAMPPDVAEQVTAAVTVPTIGIGAGAGCDGQVLVCYDLLGMTLGRTPKFAKRFAELGDRVREATAQFVSEVHERSFPGPEHSYRTNKSRKTKLAVV